MNLIIKINLDNDAFDEDPEAGVEDILDELWDKLETVKLIVQQSFVLRDSNGNTVGTVEVTE